MAIELLISGEQLSQAVRLWIVYILVGVDTLPHETKGAPNKVRQRIVRQNRLAAFIIDDEKTNTCSTTHGRLSRAATTLSTSFETVRGDYYKSSEFKETLELLRQRK